MIKKKEPTFISCKVVCACGKTYTLKKDQMNFSGYSDDCECCGSHGRVTASFGCQYCKKYQTVELAGW